MALASLEPLSVRQKKKRFCADVGARRIAPDGQPRTHTAFPPVIQRLSTLSSGANHFPRQRIGNHDLFV